MRALAILISVIVCLATAPQAHAVVEEWVARYNGPAGDSDFGTGIGVDGDGNVYVLGVSYGVGTSWDFATVKYDHEGVQQWVERYNYSDDRGRELALDSAGNIYVAGGSTGFDEADFLTIKYDSDGNEQWAARYNFVEDGWDELRALAAVGDYVYVAGTSRGDTTYNDYATIKYDSDGNEVWVARYDGPTSMSEVLLSMAVGSDGSVYATGYSPGLTGVDAAYLDYATVKYDADGNEQWVARHDGVEYDPDLDVEALAVDEGGNVYVTGGSGPTEETTDYTTVKYDPDGDEQWVMMYVGPPDGGDWATAIAFDESGNVFVTGGSEGIGTEYDYATIKYSTEQTPVEGSFNASLTQSGTVMLRWIVASLAGIETFDVWRSVSEDGPFVRVNEQHIEAASPCEFEDVTVWPETTFWYELRAIMADGSEEVVGGARPSVTTGGRLEARLCAAVPNPFAEETSVQYDVPAHVGRVGIAVYNVRGQLVRQLVDNARSPGRYVVTWDGADRYGVLASSGIYFVRLEVGGESISRRVVLLR